MEEKQQWNDRCVREREKESVGERERVIESVSPCVWEREKENVGVGERVIERVSGNMSEIKNE